MRARKEAAAATAAAVSEAAAVAAAERAAALADARDRMEVNMEAERERALSAAREANRDSYLPRTVSPRKYPEYGANRGADLSATPPPHVQIVLRSLHLGDFLRFLQFLRS